MVCEFILPPESLTGAGGFSPRFISFIAKESEKGTGDWLVSSSPILTFGGINH